MGTFQKRPPRIEAIQFTGGLESATEVIEWLHRLNTDASYVPEIMGNTEVEVSERILVNPTRRSFFILMKDEMVVWDPAGDQKLYATSKKWLLEEYEAVPDAS